MEHRNETSGTDDSPAQFLPLLLARMASLQGKAVPWHRFSMMSESTDGAPLASLTLESQAIELWRARFPTGEIQRVTGPLVNGLTPALWIGPEPLAKKPVPGLLVIRGALSTGALSCVDANGLPHEIPAGLARQGQVLLLRTDEPEFADRDDTRLASDGKSASKRRTARQWFHYAIRKRWRIFSEGALATLTVNVIALTSSFYTMQVYDRVVPTQGFSTLWVLTIGVVMAIVLELVMRQVRNRLVERGCKAIDEELSSVFFSQALSIRMDQRPRTVGTFAAQIRHFEMVRNFMTSTTLFVFADAPFAVLFIAVIWFLAGPVAVVPLAFVPISILAGFAFRRSLARLTEAHMEESNRKNGLLIEAIDGIESVKACSAEWKMLNRWQELTRTLARDEIAMKDLTSLSSNLTQTLQQLSYVGLVAAGAFAIGAGELTVGGLIACTIISGRALSPIAQLSGLIVQWQQAKTALKGLDAIMAMPPDVLPGERRVVPDHCQGRLRLEAAHFAYGPDQTVLSIDAFQVSPGERVAVLGSIGSGKSTLIKLLSGLYRPKTGRVHLDDVDMTHLSPDFVREHIGYLSQDVRLFHGSLRDNLALGLPSPTDEQILHAAKITGLDKMISAHPRGLGIEISEGGRGLSGGQRQLVGLTRLILARPRIMLLDEPTASMDPKLEEQIAERVFGMRPKDTTLVVVTHKLGMLSHFTRIVVLDRGRIVADGPRDDILRRMRGSVQTAVPTATTISPTVPPRPDIAPAATSAIASV
ncbi:MAG: type I secretion system permease/ATPase [Hydrogenophaga sp.]|uniref:type I secretion system permease/ATPase n=1 Tax=Hydrogenophaga sp. TaxID=1904254 RepID=UPI0025BDBE57|nr:type I secretion system permease/ATPase [Hydrogenophaga sp.]MBT9550679.1 type I secretion system permease/ATPase [Hydrogenophaga sp.]